MKRLSLHHPLMLLALSAAATLALYARVLALPLFMDDVVFLRITGASSLTQLFFDPLPLEAYYRPMSLLPSWIIQRLLGNSAPALHGLSLSLHLLNGWLLSLLARRLWPARRGLPALTLLLWISFPFAYEAVHWHAAIQQAMATLGILATVLFSARWWESHRSLDLGLALAASFVAFFSHEVAIVTPVLVAIFIAATEFGSDRLLLTLDPPPSAAKSQGGLARRALTLFLPMLGIAALYLVGRSLAPRLGESQGLALADLPIKLLYFAQGLAYPTAIFGGALSRGGISETLAALLTSSAGLLMLAIAAFLGQRPVGTRALFLGIAWFAISISAPLLFLPSSYVLSGPRLMLAASVGAVLAWAGLIGGLWDRLRGPERIAPAALAALILAGSVLFIHTRLDLHHVLEPLYRAVYTHAADPGRQLYINLPAWVAYREKVYALGSEGVIYQGDFFRFADLVSTNTGRSPDVAVSYWPGNAPELPAYYAPPITEQGPQFEELLGQIRDADSAWAVISLGDRFEWVRLEQGEIDGGERFGNGMRASAEAWIEGDLLRVRIGWQIDGPVMETVFVHLLCDGALVAQADGQPLAGLYPFELWGPGEARIETRTMALPADLNPACLQVAVGLYDPVSGVRVPLDSGGEALLLGVARD